MVCGDLFLSQRIEMHRGHTQYDSGHCKPDERETSKADVYNATLKVWMSNRFTSTLTEAITANSSITIKELYHRLTTNTIGSHPRLYNQSGFGNLNITTMKEWL